MHIYPVSSPTRKVQGFAGHERDVFSVNSVLYLFIKQREVRNRGGKKEKAGSCVIVKNLMRNRREKVIS